MSAGSALDAQAQVALDWTAPADCNQRDELNASVEELTGRSLEQQVSPGELKIVVTRRAADWKLSLSLLRDGQTQTRELEGEDCESVTRAAASALALILEPAEAEPAPALAAAGAASPPPAEPADAEPAAAAKPSEPAEQPPEDPEPAADRHLGVRVSGGVDFTLLPEVTPLLQVAAFYQSGSFRFELGGLLLPARDFASSEGPVELSLAAGHVRGCQQVSAGALWLAPCVDFEIGELRAVGQGVTPPSVAKALWLAPGLTFLGGYRFSPNYGLVLEAPLRLPLHNYQIRVNGAVVHELPVLDARLAIGFEARWP